MRVIALQALAAVMGSGCVEEEDLADGGDALVERPHVPGDAGADRMPDVPDAPAVLDVVDVADAPDVSDAPGVLDVVDVADAPFVPDAPASECVPGDGAVPAADGGTDATAGACVGPGGYCNDQMPCCKYPDKYTTCSSGVCLAPCYKDSECITGCCRPIPKVPPMWCVHPIRCGATDAGEPPPAPGCPTP
jgi:hypothetical protein